MFKRDIQLPENNSFFLFGARGTGKSTLVKQHFSAKTHYIDLLLADNETRFALDPDSFYREVLALEGVETVIIDEVQKVPKLLDLVHKLIEETSIRFVLTGSSARKLRHGAANLLAGRAFERSLHPLTITELDGEPLESDLIRWGSLPAIFNFQTDHERRDYLDSYSNTYLKEEVWSEQIIRKLEPFRKFLILAAQQNAKILNYSRFAQDIGVDSKVVKSYFQILEDTLLGFIIEPYLKSARKRVLKSPKFYFFDLGVARSLAKHLTIDPQPSTGYFGELFEQLVILEFIRRERYLRRDYQFYFLSTEKNELDLIIERPGRKLACIEIKSTAKVNEHTIKKMNFFLDVFPEADFFCLSRDKNSQKFGRIKALPWTQGLIEI